MPTRVPYSILVAGALHQGSPGVKLAEGAHAFVLTAHHIICDGWSTNVIVDELAAIYGALCRGEAAGIARAPTLQLNTRGCRRPAIRPRTRPKPKNFG